MHSFVLCLFSVNLGQTRGMKFSLYSFILDINQREIFIQCTFVIMLICQSINNLIWLLKNRQLLSSSVNYYISLMISHCRGCEVKQNQEHCWFVLFIDVLSDWVMYLFVTWGIVFHKHTFIVYIIWYMYKGSLFWVLYFLTWITMILDI